MFFRKRDKVVLTLTPQEARALYELYRKGQYADVMLCWAALEETDDMLGTVLDRRASALAEMTDDVKVDAKAIGNNPDLQTLADEQQQFIDADDEPVGIEPMAIPGIDVDVPTAVGGMLTFEEVEIAVDLVDRVA